MIADLLERLWMSYFQTYRHMVVLMYTSNPVLALKAEEAPFFWGLNELYLPSSTQFSKWKTAAIELFSAGKFSVIVSGDICGKTKEQTVLTKISAKESPEFKSTMEDPWLFPQEAQNSFTLVLTILAACLNNLSRFSLHSCIICYIVAFCPSNDQSSCL